MFLEGAQQFRHCKVRHAKRSPCLLIRRFPQIRVTFGGAHNLGPHYPREKKGSFFS